MTICKAAGWVLLYAVAMGLRRHALVTRATTMVLCCNDLAVDPTHLLISRTDA